MNNFSDQELSAALDEACHLHRGLVALIVNRYELQPGIERDDLISIATIGAAIGILRHDSSRGKVTSSIGIYAQRALQSEIRNQSIVRTPPGRFDARLRVRRAAAKMEQQTGGPVSAEYVAEKLGVPQERVESALDCSREFVSLDKPAGPSGDPLHDTFPGKPEPEYDGMAERLHRALERLSLRERTIVVESVCEDVRLSHIGHKYGLTPERIRQLKIRALRKLRDLLEESPGYAMREPEPRPAPAEIRKVAARFVVKKKPKPKYVYKTFSPRGNTCQ